MNNVFRSLERKWRAGTVKKTGAVLQVSIAGRVPGELRGEMSLHYLAEAMFLKGVHLSSQIYFEEVPRGGSDPPVFNSCPVAWGKLGPGRIGFVGDVSGSEESWWIILAMSGL